MNNLINDVYNSIVNREDMKSQCDEIIVKCRDSLIDFMNSHNENFKYWKGSDNKWLSFEKGMYHFNIQYRDEEDFFNVVMFIFDSSGINISTLRFPIKNSEDIEKLEEWVIRKSMIWLYKSN